MNGILVINKPPGPTSHDVVDFIRDKFGIKKAGHAGTLDPAAQGVLVILLGQATKLSSHLVKSQKEYIVKCLLGVKTDTDDTQGKIESKSPCLKYSRQQVAKELARFKGTIEQKVPRYSAVKVKGKPLYKLARAGKKVQLPKKQVHIYDIKLIDYKAPLVLFWVRCSKGTYMRSICRDLGERLKCGGCVSQLQRTHAGPFSLEEAIEFDKLKSLNPGELEAEVLPVTDYESYKAYTQEKNN